jgi:glycerol-3-phosphate acyltransferase PlsX
MRSVDYSEYGGALLLGVNGVVVIGHGRSDSNAVHNALKVAAKDLDSDVNGRAVESLAERAKQRPTP